jgi:hypothetical protein
MRREAILRRIRAALGPKKEPARTRAVAVRLAAPPPNPRPAFAGLAGAERERRLIECLEGQGATVITIPDLAALPAAVATLLGSPQAPAKTTEQVHDTACLDPGLRRDDDVGNAIGAHTSDVTPTEVGVQIPLGFSQHLTRDNEKPCPLFIADDARFTALAWPERLTPQRWTPGETLGDGFAALTHAEAAVAETGTLVLASSAVSPASLAFLPEVHLVAVRRETIAASFEETFAAHAAASPARLPRAINLVSGPSRTGDIGGRIVKGAHGPRRLCVILYGPPLGVTGPAQG